MSALQNALNEAASGKTLNGLGGPDLQRDYVYVPDALRIAVEIGGHNDPWAIIGAYPVV